MFGSQPVFHRRNRDTGALRQLPQVLIVLGGMTHDRAAAVDPQQRGCVVGQAGRAMQTDTDVLVDSGHRHGADAARVAHQVHKGALEFQAAMQGVAARHESSHFAKTGIQHLGRREGVWRGACLPSHALCSSHRQTC